MKAFIFTMAVVVSLPCWAEVYDETISIELPAKLSVPKREQACESAKSYSRNAVREACEKSGYSFGSALNNPSECTSYREVIYGGLKFFVATASAHIKCIKGSISTFSITGMTPGPIFPSEKNIATGKAKEASYKEAEKICFKNKKEFTIEISTGVLKVFTAYGKIVGKQTYTDNGCDEINSGTGLTYQCTQTVTLDCKYPI